MRLHDNPALRLVAMLNECEDRNFLESFEDTKADEQSNQIIDALQETREWTIKQFETPNFPLDRYGHKQAREWTAFEYKTCFYNLAACEGGPSKGLWVGNKKFAMMGAALVAGFEDAQLIYRIVGSPDEAIYAFSYKSFLMYNCRMMPNPQASPYDDPKLIEYGPSIPISLILKHRIDI